MLQQIFGGKTDEKEDLKKLPMAQRFRMFVQEHNAIFRSKTRGERQKRKRPQEKKS